jgi:hypothetical protein
MNQKERFFVKKYSESYTLLKYNLIFITKKIVNYLSFSDKAPKRKARLSKTGNGKYLAVIQHLDGSLEEWNLIFNEQGLVWVKFVIAVKAT